MVNFLTQKGESDMQSTTYHTETEIMTIQGSKVIVESLTPILTPKERESRRREIERGLYDVFLKYEKLITPSA